MSLRITICHHSASLVMPISEPRDEFFFITHLHSGGLFIIIFCHVLTMPTKGFSSFYYIGLIERKPMFEVSDLVRPKLAFSATGTS